jgi:myo-inositol-1(or 4)-monophosphatase
MSTLDDYLLVCQQAARTGGAIIQDWVGRAKVWSKGPGDLVTQADWASQEAVRQTVLGAFPDHCLLGEEKLPEETPVDKGTSPQRAKYRWIVDPLDGTTNFVHGIPHYCVSLALERDGELLVGTVFDPVRDECFTAAAGHGAWLNGQPIRASGVSLLSEALAAVSFPASARRDSPDVLLMLEMIGRCQAIRRTGSSALNLSYMAAGRFDMYWSYSTNIWDIAAGVLLLREAGGLVTSPTGGGFCLEKAHFLAAANESLHSQLLEVATARLPG